MDISTPSNQPSLLSYFNAVSSTGFIIGPLISGYLADIDPTLQLSLIMGASIYSINFFVVLFLLPPSKRDLQRSKSDFEKSERAAEKKRASMKFMGWSEVCGTMNIFKGFHWWSLADIIVVRFLAMFAMMVFRYNFTVFMEENFAITNTDLGKIISYSSIVSVSGSAICGVIFKYYSGFSKHIVCTLTLLFLSLLSMALTKTISHILVCLFLLSVSTSYLRICMLNLMLERGRTDEKGAILGVTYSLSSISRMLAPSIVGVTQELGSRECVYLAALFALASLLVMVVTRGGVNKETEDEARYTE